MFSHLKSVTIRAPAPERPQPTGAPTFAYHNGTAMPNGQTALLAHFHAANDRQFVSAAHQ
jgi:hypothetical protein